MNTIYINPNGGLSSVVYGWHLGVPYAHCLRGSVVVKTFVGPFRLGRAIRWSQPVTVAETGSVVMGETGDVVVHHHGTDEACTGQQHRIIPAAEVPDNVKAAMGASDEDVDMEALGERIEKALDEDDPCCYGWVTSRGRDHEVDCHLY